MLLPRPRAQVAAAMRLSIYYAPGWVTRRKWTIGDGCTKAGGSAAIPQDATNRWCSCYSGRLQVHSLDDPLISRADSLRVVSELPVDALGIAR